MTNKKGRTESAQPQKNTQSDSIVNHAVSQLPTLIDLNIKSHHGIVNHAWLIKQLRECGFIRRQIESAINEYVISGKGFFVIREYLDSQYVGNLENTRVKQRLEIWQNRGAK